MGGTLVTLSLREGERIKQQDLYFWQTICRFVLENVKQAATDITATNEEDGVAKAMEKYIVN